MCHSCLLIHTSSRAPIRRRSAHPRRDARPAVMLPSPPPRPLVEPFKELRRPPDCDGTSAKATRLAPDFWTFRMSAAEPPGAFVPRLEGASLASL